MNNPYQALLNFLASRGVTKEVFESALTIPIETASRTLARYVSDNRTWGAWWSRPKNLFRFSNTPQGYHYWINIFDISVNTLITDILTPFDEPLLTNEQIFVQFLKHYRSFAAFKRNLDPRYDWYRNLNHPIQGLSHAFHWRRTPKGHEYWSDLNRKWEQLCDEFDLTGDLDYRIIIRIR